MLTLKFRSIVWPTLYQHRIKFLMSTSTSLPFIKSAIESQKDSMTDWSRCSAKYDLYTYGRPLEWDHSQVRPNKGYTLKEGRRIYLHLYYNADRAVEDSRAFNKRMAMHHQELSSGKPKAEQGNDY